VKRDHGIRPLEIFSQLYAGDYLNDTLEFTAAEHDAFRLLLVHLWLAGRVPIMNRTFAKIAQVDVREWKEMRTSLFPLLQLAATRIENCKRAISTFDGKRLPAEYWRVVRAVILERDDYICVYCGSGGELHVDHRLSLSRGGSNGFGNLFTSCGPCNWSKGPKLLKDWKVARKGTL
jgi:hypothetical protein